MDLKAILLNCTIKKSPAVIEHLDAQGVECEKVRVVDHNIPFGVASDAPRRPRRGWHTTSFISRA